LGFFAVAVVKLTHQVRKVVQTASGEPASVGVATQSIAVPTNSLTEKQVQQRGREFRARQYIEGYRKNGRRDQPCDAEAIRFLETWLAWTYADSNNVPSPQSMADKLVAEPGCDDPLVLTIAGAVSQDSRVEQARRLEAALAGFDQSQHKAYPKFYAAVSLANDSSRQASRVVEMDHRALEYFKEALADGSFEPGDEPELAEVFINSWGYNFLYRSGAVLVPAVKEAKGYQWLGLVLEGEYEIALAWKARGGGYSDTVTAQGWQGFKDHLANARNALTKAWKLHPERVVAPERMIYVSLGDSGAEEMRTWFDRAVAAQIDYNRAWSEMRWGLRPAGMAATKRFSRWVTRRSIRNGSIPMSRASFSTAFRTSSPSFNCAEANTSTDGPMCGRTCNRCMKAILRKRLNNLTAIAGRPPMRPSLILPGVTM
jgi:hypothetical protein